MVVTLSHESSGLQTRLGTERDAIQRLEAVLQLVDRFQSGETAPGVGPSLQVHMFVLSRDRSFFKMENNNGPSIEPCGTNFSLLYFTPPLSLSLGVCWCF